MHLDTMEQIRKRVLEDMDLSEENDDARLREKIEEKVWEHGKCHLISLEEEQRYVQEIFCSLRKLDVLHLVFLYVRKYRRHRFILRSYRNYRVQIFLKNGKC